MDFLEESNTEIIRNIRHPEEFESDSFSAVEMGVGVTFIVGTPKNTDMIDVILNPDRKLVQSVRFKKPEWNLGIALAWLQNNQKKFSKYETKDFGVHETRDIKGVEIFSAGTWNGDAYTLDDLDEMVRAFNENAEHVRPFLKLGHNNEQALLKSDGMPAAGWVTKVYRDDDKLLADFEDIPDKIFRLIERRAYRKVSSEIYVNVQISDRKYKYMLGAVALLGAELPGVMNLNDIMARFSENHFKSVRFYATNQDGVKTYDNKSIDGGLQMEKDLDKEFEALEAKLDEQSQLLEDLAEQNKKFATDLDSEKTAKEELETAKAELQKKYQELLLEKQEVELEKSLDKLLGDDVCPKSAREYAKALLGAEKKEYSFGEDDDSEKLDKEGLLRKYSKLVKDSAGVNFDESSVDEKNDQETELEAIDRLVKDEQLDYAAAYKKV